MSLILVRGLWPLACNVPANKLVQLKEDLDAALSGTGYWVTLDGEGLSIRRDGESRPPGRIYLRDHELLFGGVMDERMEIIDLVRRLLAQIPLPPRLR